MITWIYSVSRKVGSRKVFGVNCVVILVGSFDGVDKLSTLFQAKQLCLGIARATILERRPATQVTQAIDVLVTAYSYSVKAGTYKEIKNEKATASTATAGASPGKTFEPENVDLCMNPLTE